MIFNICWIRCDINYLKTSTDGTVDQFQKKYLPYHICLICIIIEQKYVRYHCLILKIMTMTGAIQVLEPSFYK